MFKGKKGQALATDIGKKSKTFVPGENLPEKRADGPSKEDVAAIKVFVSQILANLQYMFYISLHMDLYTTDRKLQK